MKLRLRLPVVFASVSLVCGTLSAKDKIKTFSAPVDKVFEAAVQVAKANYTIQAIDRQGRILNFHTGVGLLTYGMEITATFDGEANGKTTATPRPANRGTLLFAWGQAKRSRISS
jgi:hypothetical protein